VPVDPTVDLPLPAAGARDRAATPAQAFELLETLAESVRPIWATAFFTGLRRGELRGLRVGDVDLEEFTITVAQGWDEKEGPIQPKTRAGARQVFVLDVLRPYLEPLVAGRGDSELVFGSVVAAFDARAVARKAERAWNALDKQRWEEELDPVVRFGLHEARHSFSTWLDHAGVSADRADRYMGHSSGSVASRYRHLLPAQMQEDRRMLDAYLAGAVTGKVVPLAVGQ
jgi:integrase